MQKELKTILVVFVSVAIIFLIFFALIFFLSTDDPAKDAKKSIGSIMRSYDLISTNISIQLENNGTTEIREDIGYQFSGCYRELYRNINIPYIPSAQRAENLFPDSPFVYDLFAECKPACQINSVELSEKLPSDNLEVIGSYGQICDKDARFYLDYSVLRGIVIGNDVAEFHYKIWGEEWDKTLETLNGEIILPSNIDTGSVDAYFNPIGSVKDFHFEANILKFSADNLDTYLEVRLVMPKGGFSANENNFILNPELQRSGIIKIQEDYKVSYYAFYSIFVIMIVFSLVLIFLVPYLLFKKYGTEPATSYIAIFEREPVKGIKQYTANAFTSGKTGSVDDNVIPATLLDLVRRRHIVITEVSHTKKGILDFGNKKDLLLRFGRNPKDIMAPAEEELFGFFLKKVKNGNELLWSDYLAQLKKEDEAKAFTAFKKRFDTLLNEDFKAGNYFDKKGNSIFKIVCGSSLVISIILIFITRAVIPPEKYPFFGTSAYVFAAVIVLSMIGLFLSPRIYGRFSEKGHEICLRTDNYRKFLKDQTLLKKYPPASVAIWDEHLVYATTFGVAEETLKGLKLAINDKSLRTSSLYPLYMNPYHISAIGSSNAIASSTIAQASHGSHGGFSGGGGIGGGFGGGGGGAR